MEYSRVRAQVKFESEVDSSEWKRNAVVYDSQKVTCRLQIYATYNFFANTFVYTA